MYERSSKWVRAACDWSMPLQSTRTYLGFASQLWDISGDKESLQPKY